MFWHRRRFLYADLESLRTMVIVVAVPGGSKAYFDDPRCVLTAELHRCPFQDCPEDHPLHLHGSYERWMVFPGGEGTKRGDVLRLLCTRTGKTVSLLPDFCLPRRQHGPGVLGRFLFELVRAGGGLLRALRTARGDAPHHSVAQSLRDGFLERAGKLKSYLARLQPRVEHAALEPVLAVLVQGLCRGIRDPERAFRHHGLLFHRRYKQGLA